MNVGAGDLRDEVTITAITASFGSFGELIETLTLVDTVFASVVPQRYTSGVEALVNALGREAVSTTYTITIYFRSDVTEGNRLTWNGKELDIKRVIDPTGRRRWLELMCEERPR